MVRTASEPSNCCRTKFLSRKLEVEGQRVLEQVYNPDLIHTSNEEQSAYTLKASLKYPDLQRHNKDESNQTTETLAKITCSVYEYIYGAYMEFR